MNKNTKYKKNDMKQTSEVAAAAVEAAHNLIILHAYCLSGIRSDNEKAVGWLNRKMKKKKKKLNVNLYAYSKRRTMHISTQQKLSESTVQQQRT